MKVRMKVSISGTRDGVDWPRAGGEVDLPDDEAAHLCASGLATPVVDVEPEKAVAPPAEKREVVIPPEPAKKAVAKKTAAKKTAPKAKD